MVFDFHFLLLLVFGWCTRYLIFPLLMIPVSRLRVRTKDKEKSNEMQAAEERIRKIKTFSPAIAFGNTLEQTFFF